MPDVTASCKGTSQIPVAHLTIGPDETTGPPSGMRQRSTPGPVDRWCRRAAGAVCRRHEALRRRPRGERAQPRHLSPASSSPCSAPPAAARPRCCACSPASRRPTSGRILLAGQDLAGVPPHRRPVNMMFQCYALFPHLTVEGNIAFGLQQDGMPKARSRRASRRC